MALGPTQVHPQQHLGPIGGFGAAGARADRQQGVALVILAAEEQIPACSRVFGGKLLGLRVDVGEDVLVALFLGQVEQFHGRPGARFEVSPELEFFAKTFGFAEDFLRAALVVPEPGRADGSVQFG